MKLKYILPLTIAAFSFSVSFAAEMKTKKVEAPTPSTPMPAEPKKEAAPAKTLPYQGTVASVDAAAKTFTTKNKDGKENVFSITDKTKIEKADGSAATLADIKAEEVVRGSRIKQGEGKWEAVKVIIGAKASDEKKMAEATPKPAEAKPADAKPAEAKPAAKK